MKRNPYNLLPILFLSFILTGCSLIKTDIESSSITITPTPTSSPTVSEYVPKDPIEIFLVQLIKDVKINFENPVKADIIWSEGESSNSLKVYFGDSFLINEPNSSLEKEKIIADYLVSKGFTLMKFNGSIGEGSRKMGYRKSDLICKTDYDTYPDETSPHLIVYCSDATKGTLRK